MLQDLGFELEENRLPVRRDESPSSWPPMVIYTRLRTDLESHEIKMLRFPGLESLGKGHRSRKTMEKSWQSKVVVQEILLPVLPLAESPSNP